MNTKDAAPKLRPLNAVAWPDPAKSDVIAVQQPRPLGRARRGRGNPLDLTCLEFQLVREVLAGHDDAEIAKRASISRGKLDACFAQVFERLGVRNRLELALLLVQSGF